MAINEELYKVLTNYGLSYQVAARLADPATDAIAGVAVADPAAITSTDSTSPNATNPANATYTLADQTAIAVLANELKVDHNALRAEVVALRTTVAALLTALRGAGVLAP